MAKRVYKESSPALPAPKPTRTKKDPGDDAMLKKYEHHRAQAQKHNAHADLVEAKLRTQGKHISHVYDDKKGASKRVIRHEERY